MVQGRMSRPIVMVPWSGKTLIGYAEIDDPNSDIYACAKQTDHSFSGSEVWHFSWWIEEAGKWYGTPLWHCGYHTNQPCGHNLHPNKTKQSNPEVLKSPVQRRRLRLEAYSPKLYRLLLLPVTLVVHPVYLLQTKVSICTVSSHIQGCY